MKWDSIVISFSVVLGGIAAGIIIAVVVSMLIFLIIDLWRVLFGC